MIVTAVDPEDSLPIASVAVAVKVFIHSNSHVMRMLNFPSDRVAHQAALTVSQL